MNYKIRGTKKRGSARLGTRAFNQEIKKALLKSFIIGASLLLPSFAKSII